jgi:hypothetical protein
VIDFVAVLFGYATSGERTLDAFYEWLRPWAEPLVALFGRDRLPARSTTLSRFLAALTPEPVESLRTLILEDLLARSLGTQEQVGGLWDRAGLQWVVFDVDGTREAARQRALPQTPELPASHRRLRELCAPGYTVRKRGEVVRTAPPPCRRRSTDGSARLAGRATESLGRNCAGWWSSSGATSLRTISRKTMPCCDWMDNMARWRLWQISQNSRM